MAQALRVRQRTLLAPKPLAIREVDQAIIDMAKMTGVCVCLCVCVCVLGSA